MKRAFRPDSGAVLAKDSIAPETRKEATVSPPLLPLPLAWILTIAALTAVHVSPANAQGQPVTPAASAELKAVVDDDDGLRSAAERIRKEQEFARLRRERNDLLQGIPKAKTEVDALQSQIAGARAEISEIKSRLAVSSEDEDPQQWAARLIDAEARLERKRAEGKKPGEDERKFETEVDNLKGEIDWLQYKVSRAEAAVAARKDLEKRSAELATRTSDLEREMSVKQKAYEALLERQFLVEDAINVMLIPETARNQFKLYITGAFSALVALVILGFFVVSALDESVRRSIFSSQSGIQFLTLFSLVIAIILFGITDILGGKELAALLGGLSGYILGRVSDRPSPPPAAQG